ncbi:hypothetical protein MPSEU_000229500 [Mayamaea pseudoterrestris]|nr:hypothetical protein MPSEU_000229500 [Mayamaea pseudoterrestris]
MQLHRSKSSTRVAFDYQAHLSTVVTQEEVAHHLRQSAKTSLPLPSLLSRLVAAAPQLRRRKRRSSDNKQVDVHIDLMEVYQSPDSSSSIQQDVIKQSLTEPLMLASVWESLTGNEFQKHPDLVEGLTSMGEKLIRSLNGGEWIDWKEYGKHGASFDANDSETIHVWTGRAKQGSSHYHGADVPLIKSQSRIPLSPVELKDLLLDSSRIKTYNPWSIGRIDCWIHDSSDAAAQIRSNKKAASESISGTTKIVKNKVQPPVGSALVGVTLLHAKPLDQGAWLVVSRAVGGQAYFDNQDLSNAGRSDILLGVNLIEPISDDQDSCILTSITHAASSSVPSMLAERFGVKGAVKFVQDIRKLRVAA